jgi:hypothetical protein
MEVRMSTPSILDIEWIHQRLAQRRARRRALARRIAEALHRDQDLPPIKLFCSSKERARSFLGLVKQRLRELEGGG